MGYFVLQDFAAGIDLRKNAATAPPGTLRVLRNGFVNPGGEVEKRRKFSQFASLDTFTSGLGGINTTLYAIGTAAGITPPTPVQYHRLFPAGGAVTISSILDVDVFNSKLFVTARMSDNSVRRFYDGAEVTTPVDMTGLAARTYGSKVYTVEGSLLRGSAINNPSQFTAGVSGAFVTDVTQAESGAPDLLAIERYYNLLALFGRRAIQLWSVDADPAKNQLVETLSNAGIIGSQALVRYGNGDVMFVSNTGIRSVRARDSSNAAVLNDIGSPIDQLIIDRRLALSGAESEKIFGLVDPMTGHAWFIWGSTVYVLAYYPASKVTAWSTFELPFPADFALVAGPRVVIRAGNAVYIYGGFNNAANALDNYVPSNTVANEYDNTECVVQTAYLDFNAPATVKHYWGMDVAIEGSWFVEASFDPLQPNAWEALGTFTSTTYTMQSIPMVGQSTHLALRFTSKNTGPAKLGAVAIHHNLAEAD